MAEPQPKVYSLQELADTLEAKGSLVQRQRPVKPKKGTAGAGSASSSGDKPQMETVIYVNIVGHTGPINFQLGRYTKDPLYNAPFLGKPPSKHPEATSDDVVSAFICVPDRSDIINLGRIMAWMRKEVVTLNTANDGKTAFLRRKKDNKPVDDLDEFELWKDFISMPKAGEFFSGDPLPEDAKKTNASIGVKWAVGASLDPKQRTKLKTFRKSESGSIVFSAHELSFDPTMWPSGTKVWSILNFNSIVKTTVWGTTVYARSAATEANAAPAVAPSWTHVPVEDGISIVEEGSAGAGGGGGHAADEDSMVDAEDLNADEAAFAASAPFDPASARAHAEEAAALAAAQDAEAAQWASLSGFATNELGLSPDEITVASTPVPAAAAAEAAAAPITAAAAVLGGAKATLAKPRGK